MGQIAERSRSSCSAIASAATTFSEAFAPGGNADPVVRGLERRRREPEALVPEQERTRKRGREVLDRRGLGRLPAPGSRVPAPAARRSPRARSARAATARGAQYPSRPGPPAGRSGRRCSPSARLLGPEALRGPEHAADVEGRAQTVGHDPDRHRRGERRARVADREEVLVPPLPIERALSERSARSGCAALGASRDGARGPGCRRSESPPPAAAAQRGGALQRRAPRLGCSQSPVESFQRLEQPAVDRAVAEAAGLRARSVGVARA